MNSLVNRSLMLHSPPRLQKASAFTSERVDISASAVGPGEAHCWKRALGVTAALSIGAVPQLLAGGSEAVVQEVEMIDRLEIDLLAKENPLMNVLEGAKDKAESVKDWATEVRERLDPYGVLDEHQTDVGDYTLSFQAADIDVGPRWKDGSPAFKLRGEFLETSLGKSETMDNGWLMSQGARGRLKGDFSTYRETTLDAEAGVFRQYQGELAEGYQATFAFEAGARFRVLGPDDGLRVGVSARQKIEGGEFQVLGRTLSLYAEGRQSLGYNFGSQELEFGYKFMAGPRYDMEVDAFGQDLDVSIIVGPEIKGNTSDEMFELGLGTKVKFSF